MGYFSQLAAELDNAGYSTCECQSCFGLEKHGKDEYERAIEVGLSLMGNCNFVRSCSKFLKENGFLTEKQIYALKNPRV